MSTLTIDRPRNAGPGEGLGGPCHVIVLNDNHNTFEHAARSFASTLPGVNFDKGYQLAEEIHYTGQAIVWSGERELAEHYWEQLNDAGLTMAPLREALMPVWMLE